MDKVHQTFGHFQAGLLLGVLILNLTEQFLVSKPTQQDEGKEKSQSITKPKTQRPTRTAGGELRDPDRDPALQEKMILNMRSARFKPRFF